MKQPNLSHYAAALALTKKIDDHLTVSTSSGHAGHTSSHHYWTKDGKLLTTLDQVVSAILDGSLLIKEDLNNEKRDTLPKTQ